MAATGAGAGAGAHVAGNVSPLLQSMRASMDKLPPMGKKAVHRRVLTLDGETLTPESLMSVSEHTRVELSDAAWERIRVGRKHLDDAIASGKTVYGVNTGFGSCQNTIIPPDKLMQLQVNLIRSHAAGMGEPLAPERVRRLLALRINVLCKGFSGVRVVNVERLLAILNAGCLSKVPLIGSVGASGDLAPLAHLALGNMGEGEMWNPATKKYEPAADVLKYHGLEPIELAEKEGLAMINGTQFIATLTAEAVIRAETVAHSADIVAAVSMEALKAQPGPFEARVQDARGQVGQKGVASRLRDLLHSEAHPSRIFEESSHSVQDAYSIRCVPQVHGVVHEMIGFAKTLITRELNAATDNPMVFADSVISAGNFHGEYPAKCADMLAMAVSELATISERRIERLINNHLSGPTLPKSQGDSARLPPFLMTNSGLNSGFMIPHCTAAAIVVENRTLVHPASCDSISTSAAQEDHVSMGAYAARKALNVVENVERVIGIELLAACQGIGHLRPLTSTAAIERVVATVREKVPFWENDQYAAPHMQATFDMVRTGAIVRAVDASLSVVVDVARTSLTRPLSLTSVHDYDTESRHLQELALGIPAILPPAVKARDPAVPHPPARPYKPTPAEARLALRNALRYFPKSQHAELAPEFLQELRDYGHIYMYRLRPTAYEMKAYPISKYPVRTPQAAAIMLMIQNNLNPAVAQFPHELVTYGGNGSVFSNWAQYHLAMKYLATMSRDQTLVMYSGHPLGLFPSSKHAPLLVVTNGMVVPNYSGRSDYERMYMLGVSQYGQMTAGSYCYIGPQGIVHGTTLTLLNAARKYLNTSNMNGLVFVSAGLGGMSGAQAKAALICGAVGVIAEVSEAALMKRHAQGWVQAVSTNLDDLVSRVRAARAAKRPLSIGYHGNIVDVWRRFSEEEEMLVDLGSDQTSLHNPFNGGYYPVQLSFDEANKMMVSDPAKFKGLVQESLRLQVSYINKLSKRGLRFWDYGNSFLLEAGRANADITVSTAKDASGAPVFKYPSYVEDIMGEIFSLGFGPFRWVCTSGLEEDLRTSDQIATQVIRRLRDDCVGKHKELSRQHYDDNHLWISNAMDNKLVVGSQARILYSDAEGRCEIALAFNRAVRERRLTGPIVISRDHHDVSGTDSPFRETTNIKDGSKFCADMAVQNAIGDSFRGATWVALHNGGGTGWGEAMNGGFGMVLDGSLEMDERAKSMLQWDVLNGVSRRAWDGHSSANFTIKRAMQQDVGLRVTTLSETDPALLDELVPESVVAGAGAGAGAATTEAAVAPAPAK